MPLKKFGESQIKAFAQAMRAAVLTPGSQYAKVHLRTLVSEIRISAAGATMKGSYADMASAASARRPGTPELMVPRHLSNWRPRQESNLYLALRRRSFYPLNYGG